MDAPARRKDSLEDHTLVRQAVDGDADAYVTLVRRHQHRVAALTHRFLHDPRDVEEVTQDTFVLAWKNITGFRSDAAFTTWLHRIAVNAALARARQNRAPAAPLGHAQDRLADGDTPPDRVVAIRDALDRLPERYRTVVVLRDVEGYTTDQVARLLGVHPRNVKSRLHRGRRALARLLHPA